jgi:ABC-type uncharacterized transport system YnjBCD permease subunit
LSSAKITALVEAQPDMAEVRGIARGHRAVVVLHYAPVAEQTTSSLPVAAAEADTGMAMVAPGEARRVKTELPTVTELAELNLLAVLVVSAKTDTPVFSTQEDQPESILTLHPRVAAVVAATSVAVAQETTLAAVAALVMSQRRAVCNREVPKAEMGAPQVLYHQPTRAHQRLVARHLWGMC